MEKEPLTSDQIKTRSQWLRALKMICFGHLIFIPFIKSFTCTDELLLHLGRVLFVPTVIYWITKYFAYKKHGNYLLTFELICLTIGNFLFLLGTIYSIFITQTSLGKVLLDLVYMAATGWYIALSFKLLKLNGEVRNSRLKI